MKITKYEHACFVVEKDSQLLVVDPGAYTTPLLDERGVVAIVVTHEHQDHWTPDQIRRILANNPEAKLFSTAATAAAAAPEIEFTVVGDGDVIDVGVFSLKFFGVTHAVIHESIPVIDNVGVMVNDAIFYPGDSFTIPPEPVDVLAVPSSAPWLKIGEVMDYVAAVKPRRSFAVHEMINSVIGKKLANDRIATVTEAGGGQFYGIDPGESFEV